MSQIFPLNRSWHNQVLALSSGMSGMIHGNPIHPTHRPNSQALHTVVSNNGFGIDYLEIKKDRLIIKHDRFQFLANKQFFQIVDKSKNEHHHIQNIDNRIHSVQSLPKLIN